jgi:hypothetical protein
MVDGEPMEVRCVMSREMGFSQAIADPVPFRLEVPEGTLLEAASALWEAFVVEAEVEANAGILEQEDRWMHADLSGSLRDQIARDPAFTAHVLREWFMPEVYWRLLEGPEDRADLAFVLNDCQRVWRHPDGHWVFEGEGWVPTPR